MLIPSDLQLIVCRIAGFSYYIVGLTVGFANQCFPLEIQRNSAFHNSLGQSQKSPVSSYPSSST